MRSPVRQGLPSTSHGRAWISRSSRGGSERGRRSRRSSGDAPIGNHAFDREQGTAADSDPAHPGRTPQRVGSRSGRAVQAVERQEGLHAAYRATGAYRPSRRRATADLEAGTSGRVRLEPRHHGVHGCDAGGHARFRLIEVERAKGCKRSNRSRERSARGQRTTGSVDRERVTDFHTAERARTGIGVEPASPARSSASKRTPSRGAARATPSQARPLCDSSPRASSNGRHRGDRAPRHEHDWPRPRVRRPRLATLASGNVALDSLAGGGPA
jgi:hypothetical protein